MEVEAEVDRGGGKGRFMWRPACEGGGRGRSRQRQIEAAEAAADRQIEAAEAAADRGGAEADLRGSRRAEAAQR